MRVLVMAAMALVAVNIWTGAPLLALWVGSRIQGESGLTMGSVFVVIAVMASTMYGLVRLLAVLGARHDRLRGREPARRQQLPWMRSFSGERLSDQRARHPASALDVLLVAMVVIAALAFEIWFFFYSGAPI
jgi:hypothetical protein